MKLLKKTLTVILTAVMLFSFASCGEKAETESLNTLNAQGTLINSDFLSSYKEDPENNSRKITGFGFTADEFNKKFVENGNWNTYNLKIEFGNDNDFGITVFGIDVEENGKKNIFVSTASDAVIGLPSNFENRQETYCKVIADSALSETDIIKTLKTMGLNLLYVNASTGAEELSEVNAGELLYSKIDFIL